MPREICSFGLKSPKLSEKPLITKWCFDPNEESSVHSQDDPEKSEDVEDSEDVEESGSSQILLLDLDVVELELVS